MKTRVVSATVALLSAFGAGCGSAPRPMPQSAPHTMTSSQALTATSARRADDETARVLRRELAADEGIGGQAIVVNVDDGVATLEGHLTNRRAAERALAIAPIVRGVRAVVDHLDVVPTRRPDDVLEAEVAAALGRDPALAHQNIAARVRDGVVSLTGDVDNVAAKQIAISDVQAIPGVTGTTDWVAIVPRDGREDADLVSETQRLLRDDPWLDASHVRVTADHGLLTLAGWMGSAAELARAERDARMVSPGRLDTTGLEVDGAPADDGTLRATPTPVRPDEELAQAVTAAYTHDRRLRLFVPGTDVRNGVVLLTGIAPNEEAMRVAIDDARNVPGVNDVRSTVQVRSAIVKGDDVVQTDVYSAIKRDPHLAIQPITVSVLHGRVLLRGAVRTPEDRLAAIAAASSIPGVSDVVDVIDVAPRTTRRGEEPPGRAEAQAPNDARSPSAGTPWSLVPMRRRSPVGATPTGDATER